VLVAAQELNKEAALALPFHLLCFKSHFAGKQGHAEHLPCLWPY
jgi:hypothetical protein